MVKTNIIKEIRKDIKNIFHIRDKKRFVLQNLSYLFFFYLRNTFFAHIGRYVGGDIIDKIFQGILEIQKMSFIPSIYPADLLAGIVTAFLIKFIVHAKMKNAKKFRQGVEYGSAR